MQTIKHTIQNFMEELQNKQRVARKSDPQRLLQAALSRKDLQHVRFSYFKKGVLGIEVDSSARLYLLNLRKETILEKLRKKPSGIKDIRFRLGVLE